MHTIYLALGSNVGDRQQMLLGAIDALREKVSDIVVAPIYETKPWGFAQQASFYNTVIRGNTSLSPNDLFTLVKTVEESMGRVKRFVNGPREIDIDILLYDAIVAKQDLASLPLIIPHPRMHERDFVLQPLADLAPDLIHPVYNKTIVVLLSLIQEEDRSIIMSV